MNHKISHLKGLQRTTPEESGAQTCIECTRIMCLPPTTFLFMWLRNKIRFAIVVDTHKTTWFLVRNEHKISHLKRIAEDNTRQVGEQTSTQRTRILCVPPSTVISLWLWNEIYFTAVEGTKTTTWFLIRNEHKTSHLKGLQTTPD